MPTYYHLGKVALVLISAIINSNAIVENLLGRLKAQLKKMSV